MENKSFIDQIIEIRKDTEVSYVNYFNDGVVREDKYSDSKEINSVSTWSLSNKIRYTLERLGELLRLKSDFDYLELNLLVGLMYNPKDYEKNGNSFEGLTPYNTIRVFSKELCGNINGKKLSLDKTWNSILQFSGYAEYDELVKTLNEEGIPFNGPKSFEELKTKITTGEPFEIKAYVDLRKKEVTSEEPKLEQVEPALTRKRCLFKRRNK